MDRPAEAAVLGRQPAGLTSEEAAHRLAHDGPNELPHQRDPSVAARVLRHLVEPLSLVLVAAGLASVLVLGHALEGLAIVAIVVLNVAVGTAQETKAATAVAALEEMTAPVARVRRDGTTESVPASTLVVGDLVEIAAGDRVPADVTLVAAAGLAIDEALITGEAFPADKDATGQTDNTASAADRPGEAFAGTTVVRGRGSGVVSQTGAATQIGVIAGSLRPPSDPPLIGDLRIVASRMSALAVVLGIALVPIAAMRGEGDDAWVTAILAGVALAIAAIPEGLATVVVTSLALGARRMAGRGAIVRRLAAIDALGSADVICTDKTGTITTGVLATRDVVAVPGREDELWRAALRCNDAQGDTGDPIDIALARGASEHGVTASGARVDEVPFDSATRTMATVHEVDGRSVLSLKGAPEAVLPRCTAGPDLDDLAVASDRLARQGLRVLALATLETDNLHAAGLRALGVVAFHDPLRSSAVDAIARCRGAGLRVVLVTGDHLATSRYIAAEAGIVGDAVSGAELAGLGPGARADRLLRAAVIARVDPGTKLDLVEAHQGAGSIVAMTGDGVNDAPALQRADIGVAIAGEGGTDVAREAADVVVTNGDLSTIVAAVAEGRRIFRNLRSVVAYLLTGNLSEILVVAAALVLLPDLAVPLLPVQLLWVNLVTDGWPALALGVDRPASDPLTLPPSDRTGGLLGRRGLAILGARGAVVALAVIATGLVASRWAWDAELVRSQLLLSLLGAHLMLAYASRAVRSSFEPGWWRSRTLGVAIGASLALQILAFCTPAGRSILQVAALPPVAWALAGLAALVAIAVIDLGRMLASRPKDP